VLTSDHNTVVGRTGTFYSFLKFDAGSRWVNGEKVPSAHAVDDLTVTNNLTLHGVYGVIGGTGKGYALNALNNAVGRYTWLNNVLAGGPASYAYPETTQRPTVESFLAQFEGDDFRLKPEAAHRTAGTDGKDLGAELVDSCESARVTLEAWPMITVRCAGIHSSLGGQFEAL
jgi:hypothetical protein